MLVEIQCDHCGRVFRVNGEAVGRQGKCPCGSLVAIAVRRVEEPMPIERTSVRVSKAALAAADEAAETRGAWKLAAAAGGVAFAGLLAAVSIVAATWPSEEIVAAPEVVARPTEPVAVSPPKQKPLETRRANQPREKPGPPPASRPEKSGRYQ